MVQVGFCCRAALRASLVLRGVANRTVGGIYFSGVVDVVVRGWIMEAMVTWNNNKRRAMAQDKAQIRKEAEQYFELFKKMQGEERDMVVLDECSTAPLPEELEKALTRITPPPKRKKKKTPENQVVRSCLELLKTLGIFAWRNNTGAVTVGTRFIRYGYTGSSDIIGLMPCGQFLAVECKAPGGKQSAAQRIFQNHIETHGGRYLLVTSAAELAHQL